MIVGKREKRSRRELSERPGEKKLYIDRVIKKKKKKKKEKKS